MFFKANIYEDLTWSQAWGLVLRMHSLLSPLGSLNRSCCHLPLRGRGTGKAMMDLFTELEASEPIQLHQLWVHLEAQAENRNSSQ